MGFGKLGSEPNFVLAFLCSGKIALLNWDLTPISQNPVSRLVASEQATRPEL